MKIATDLITDTHEILADCPLLKNKTPHRKKIIPLLGTTGVGKSTLAQYLQGKEIVSGTDYFGRTKAIVVGEGEEQVSHGSSRSHTLYPTFVPLSNGYNLLDLPGMLDSRGKSERLAIMAQIKHALDTSAQIPAVIVVISLDSFATTARSQPLMETAQILATLFDNNPEVLKSTYFVITKSEDLEKSYFFDINSALRTSLKKEIVSILKAKRIEVDAFNKRIKYFREHGLDVQLNEALQEQKSLQLVMELLAYIHQHEGQVLQGNPFDGGESRDKILKAALSDNNKYDPIPSAAFNFSDFRGLSDHLDGQINEFALLTLPLLRQLNKNPRAVELATCEKERAVELQNALAEQITMLSSKDTTIQRFAKSTTELKAQKQRVEKQLQEVVSKLDALDRKKLDLTVERDELNTDELIVVKRRQADKPTSFYYDFWGFFGYDYDGNDKSTLSYELGHPYHSHKVIMKDQNGVIEDISADKANGKFAATYRLKVHSKSAAVIEFYEKQKVWKSAKISDLQRRISEEQREIDKYSKTKSDLREEIVRLTETIECISNQMDVVAKKRILNEQVIQVAGVIQRCDSKLQELAGEGEQLRSRLNEFKTLLEQINGLRKLFRFRQPLTKELLKAYRIYRKSAEEQVTVKTTVVPPWEDVIKGTSQTTKLDQYHGGKVNCQMTGKIMDNPSFIRTCGDWFELNAINDFITQQDILDHEEVDVMRLIGKSEPLETCMECPKCGKGFSKEDLVVTGPAVDVMKHWIQEIKAKALETGGVQDITADTLEKTSEYRQGKLEARDLKSNVKEILEILTRMNEDRRLLFNALRVAQDALDEKQALDLMKEGKNADEEGVDKTEPDTESLLFTFDERRAMQAFTSDMGPSVEDTNVTVHLKNSEI